MTFVVCKGTLLLDDTLIRLLLSMLMPYRPSTHHHRTIHAPILITLDGRATLTSYIRTPTLSLKVLCNCL